MSEMKEIAVSFVNAINIPQRGMNAISKLLSPALNESGEYIADFFREKRVLRQIDAADKIQQKALSKNIPLKSLPEKFIYPAMHYISIEDEEDLKTKWVNLLTNALEATNIDFYNSYSEILSKLNTYEVQVLDYINSNPNNTLNTYFEKKEIENNFSIQVDSLDIILDNLARLNLIEYVSIPLSRVVTERPNKIRFTALGKGFIDSVKD